jgi:hypothetical protein
VNGINNGVAQIRRFIPVVSLVLSLVTSLFICLKIVRFGLVPPGDARRHTAKAVTSKEYTDVLVLRPGYTMDHSPGWDWLLRSLHRKLGWNEDALISFSIAGCLACILLVPAALLRRPEAWLAALLAQMVAIPDLMGRFTQGRPYLVTEAVLICLLLGWAREPQAMPGWPKMALTCAGFALSAWLHGTWYLWGLPLAAFFLARSWRAGICLTVCWAAGTFLGALLTGRPIEFLRQALFIAATVYREHAPSWLLVGEFQPSAGEFSTLLLLAAVFIWRRCQSRGAPPLLGQPLFWMMATGWILGFQADRFWADWGVPAAMVWMASQFDEIMATSWDFDSEGRLAICALVSAALFLNATSDLGGRYSRSLREGFVDLSQPRLQGWAPAGGGIFYSADMAFFYNTFYRYPEGNWRYILGFEPALMPPEDLETFRKIQWNQFAWEAYKPWIAKMRPQDRLEISGRVQPELPELEWEYAGNGTWIGRLPHPASPK